MFRMVWPSLCASLGLLAAVCLAAPKEKPKPLSPEAEKLEEVFVRTGKPRWVDIDPTEWEAPLSAAGESAWEELTERYPELATRREKGAAYLVQRRLAVQRATETYFKKNKISTRSPDLLASYRKAFERAERAAPRPRPEALLREEVLSDFPRLRPTPGDPYAIDKEREILRKIQTRATYDSQKTPQKIGDRGRNFILWKRQHLALLKQKREELLQAAISLVDPLTHIDLVTLEGDRPVPLTTEQIRKLSLVEKESALVLADPERPHVDVILPTGWEGGPLHCVHQLEEMVRSKWGENESSRAILRVMRNLDRALEKQWTRLRYAETPQDIEDSSSQTQDYLVDAKGEIDAIADETAKQPRSPAWFRELEWGTRLLYGPRHFADRERRAWKLHRPTYSRYRKQKEKGSVLSFFKNAKAPQQGTAPIPLPTGVRLQNGFSGKWKRLAATAVLAASAAVFPPTQRLLGLAPQFTRGDSLGVPSPNDAPATNKVVLSTEPLYRIVPGTTPLSHIPTEFRWERPDVSRSRPFHPSAARKAGYYLASAKPGDSLSVVPLAKDEDLVDVRVFDSSGQPLSENTDYEIREDPGSGAIFIQAKNAHAQGFFSQTGYAPSESPTPPWVSPVVRDLDKRILESLAQEARRSGLVIEASDLEAAIRSAGERRVPISAVETGDLLGAHALYSTIAEAEPKADAKGTLFYPITRFRQPDGQIAASCQGGRENGVLFFSEYYRRLKARHPELAGDIPQVISKSVLKRDPSSQVIRAMDAHANFALRNPRGPEEVALDSTPQIWDPRNAEPLTLAESPMPKLPDPWTSIPAGVTANGYAAKHFLAHALPAALVATFVAAQIGKRKEVSQKNPSLPSQPVPAAPADPPARPKPFRRQPIERKRISPTGLWEKRAKIIERLEQIQKNKKDPFQQRELARMMADSDPTLPFRLAENLSRQVLGYREGERGYSLQTVAEIVNLALPPDDPRPTLDTPEKLGKALHRAAMYQSRALTRLQDPQFVSRQKHPLLADKDLLSHTKAVFGQLADPSWIDTSFSSAKDSGCDFSSVAKHGP